jgi:hypothetical protein
MTTERVPHQPATKQVPGRDLDRELAAPPHSLEAEQAVLGGLLSAQQGDAEILDQAISKLGAGDFYRQAHARTFSAIELLHRQGRIPDLVSVMDVLRQAGTLDEAGGALYVTGLLNVTFSPATLPHHVEILRRDTIKRTLAELGGHLAYTARNGQDVDALIAYTSRVLDDVQEARTAGGTDQQKKHRATAIEILEAPEPRRPWWPFLQPQGILGPGVVGLFSGYAKSGKTTTTAHGLNAILQACPDLRVIWCTEEARSLWRARLLRWRFHWPTVTLIFRSATPWSSLVTEIRQEHPDLVIIDTARAFLGIEDENDAGQWRTALDQPLLMARQDDAGFLFLHHLRKSGGEDGLGHAGNHALVAAVDVALELRRDGPRRTVRAISRFDETPPAWVMELRDDGLAILGDPETVTQADLLSRLVASLDGTPRTVGELTTDLDDPKPSGSAVYAGLKALHRQGRAERSGKGTRSHPYRWAATVDSSSSPKERDWKNNQPAETSGKRENDSSSYTPLRVEERISLRKEGLTSQEVRDA